MNEIDNDDFDLDLSEDVDFSEGGELPDIDEDVSMPELEEPHYGAYVLVIGVLLLLIVVPVIIGVILVATSQGTAARDFAATEQQIFATNTSVAKAIVGTQTAKAWTATPSNTPTPTSTATNTSTATLTPTFTSTFTPTVTFTTTFTSTPTSTPTFVPTPSDTPTITPTPLSPAEMTATTFVRVSTQIAATLTAEP